MAESRMRSPWAHDLSEVIDTLRTDPRAGLTATEAENRLRQVGLNQLEPELPVPVWRRIAGQLADPLVYLLLAAVVVSLAVWVVEGADGVPYEAIVILVIVLLDAALGYIQESRAEQAVAALQQMAATTATVVRDGRAERIPATGIVPGDVLLLAEGDAVSADARLVSETALAVAEAALTGESEPVPKATASLPPDTGLGDRTNMVFSGTAIIRGHGLAVVTATGMATEMGGIARLLESAEEAPTPLQREVGAIGRALGIAVVVIAAIVVGAIILTTDIDSGSDVVDVLLIGVSLAVAAVPEGLPVVLSVVLALGVQRMARQRAIVKNLASVETLGSASVVCSDKTGTLTRNEMTIERVVTPSGDAAITGSGYHPAGEVLAGGQPIADDTLLEEIRLVLVAGSIANDAILRQVGRQWTIQGDPTEAAFLVAEGKVEGLTAHREARFARLGDIPFTSERRIMSAIATDDLRGGVTLMTKGAPDTLLGRCTHERVAGHRRPLTPERRREIMEAVDRLADDAMRPLAVAYRPLGADESELADTSMERDLVYLGVVGIIDPPRDEARGAIDEAHRAGIRVVMITGDHPRTAGRIAGDLGILAPGATVLTGAEIDGAGEDRLRELARTASVYARVAPEHKLRIVDALQADGQIVAMTGDGVNDAPALKSADIGVAMGITGTAVAKEAAHMILADDNFATIIAAAREGRGIFANIRKFMRFLLSSNVGEVLTMFLGVMLADPLGIGQANGTLAVPLLATHILWINLLTDTGPALALGIDPPPADLMRRPPRRITDRVIDRGMWGMIVWIGLVMAAVSLFAIDLRLPGGLVEGSGTLVEARTMAFTTLVFAQLFNTLNARWDRASAFHRLFTNRWLWGAIALSIVLQVAVVQAPLLNDAFETTPLDAGDYATCVTLASIVLWAEEIRKLACRVARRRESVR